MADDYSNQANIDDMVALSFDERLTLLIDAEHDNRHHNKIARLTKQAKLYEAGAHLENIKYLPDRGLNKEEILQLADNRYIKKPQNLVLTGATGSGKSFIACALGNHVCQNGFKAIYVRLPDLLTEMAMTRAEHQLEKVQSKYKKCDLLILDEFLLIPATDMAQQEIFELLESRYRHSATIFYSQFGTESWLNRLGSGALAESIIDRALPKAKIIHIAGDKSMRSR